MKVGHVYWLGILPLGFGLGFSGLNLVSQLGVGVGLVVLFGCCLNGKFEDKIE